jgi:putative ABC transport system substrate-binding protein
MMRRREFITLLGGGAAAWPLAARAQQPSLPVIGFLNSGSSTEREPFVATFRQGLKETGYVEGQNVRIEYRWAEGHYDRLPALAADLVRQHVSVFVSAGGSTTALAAKAATATIPIVFGGGGDPVQLGLVASLNRPGGNMTGVYILDATEAKRLGLLRELVPTAAVIAVLLNPSNVTFQAKVNDVEQGARTVGQQIRILKASNDREIETAFTSLLQLRAGALAVAPDPFFSDQRDQLVALAARYGVPTIYSGRDFVNAGGLISYGISAGETYRQLGVYTGRILKGEKAADLPVVQSTKFEFLINLKTAKALGLQVPPGLSASADEVIE